MICVSHSNDINGTQYRTNKIVAMFLTLSHFRLPNPIPTHSIK